MSDKHARAERRQHISRQLSSGDGDPALDQSVECHGLKHVRHCQSLDSWWISDLASAIGGRHIPNCDFVDGSSYDVEPADSFWRDRLVVWERCECRYLVSAMHVSLKLANPFGKQRSGFRVAPKVIKRYKHIDQLC